MIQFQHPVAPGNGEGGWMIPPEEKQGEAGGKSDLKTFSLEEIAKHNKEVRALVTVLFLSLTCRDVRTTRGSSWTTRCTT